MKKSSTDCSNLSGSDMVKKDYKEDDDRHWEVYVEDLHDLPERIPSENQNVPFSLNKRKRWEILNGLPQHGEEDGVINNDELKNEGEKNEGENDDEDDEDEDDEDEDDEDEDDDETISAMTTSQYFLNELASYRFHQNRRHRYKKEEKNACLVANVNIRNR